MAQYDAMNFILKNETKNSVHGFRFYLGNKKEGAEPIIIVVGTGSPDKTHPIVVTPGPGSGPCPYVCDNGSPITK